MKLKKKDYSDNYVLEQIGPDTKKALRKHHTRIKTDTFPMAYSRKNPKHSLKFRTGYDLMRYSIVVRPFIVKLYKLESDLLLDILVYLFPIQYFTNKDYKLLPLYNTKFNLKQMVFKGYVDCAVEQSNFGSKVYCLSEKSIKVVVDYYKYMSGEKRIGKASSVNPFKDPEATRMDIKREKLMQSLKERFESQPHLFKNTYF